VDDGFYQNHADKIILVEPGLLLLCDVILDLYNEDGIITESAGVLSMAALNYLPEKEICNNKTIVFFSK